MTDINSIAKEINTKVHDQRSDLIEIDTNAGSALENAKEAEKNIEEAQEHQKSGGKCMYWTVGIIGIGALVIILIVVLALVK
jgi:t-SNARE complex subunit (syntaxin)